MATQRNNSRVWRNLRLAVLDRDRWLCQIHGPTCTNVATCVDHVEPVADGGAYYDPANLRAACVACNARRGALLVNRQRRRHDRTYPYRTGVAEYLSRF
jgi:5-methylcytosine-specific restriction endonuclease McrA